MPASGTPTVDLLERYADLENEYAQLDEAFGELEDQYRTLAEEYGRIRNQLIWTHSMLAITVEEQGGLVEIAKKTIEEYDGSLSQIRTYESPDGESYYIEVRVVEDE